MSALVDLLFAPFFAILDFCLTAPVAMLVIGACVVAIIIAAFVAVT